MARTTVLATGVTAADSSDIVVAQGQTVTIAIYQDGAGLYPLDVRFTLSQVTPGIVNPVAVLSSSPRQLLVTGPGTFRVSRPAYTGTPFGVFTEN